MVEPLRLWLRHRLDRPPNFTLPGSVPWLFPNIRGTNAWYEGDHGHRPGERLQAVAKRAGIEGMTFQSLRRSLACHLEAHGLGQALITRCLRNTSQRNLQSGYQSSDIPNRIQQLRLSTSDAPRGIARRYVPRMRARVGPSNPSPVSIASARRTSRRSFRPRPPRSSRPLPHDPSYARPVDPWKGPAGDWRFRDDVGVDLVTQASVVADRGRRAGRPGRRRGDRRRAGQAGPFDLVGALKSVRDFVAWWPTANSRLKPRFPLHGPSTRPTPAEPERGVPGDGPRPRSAAVA